MNKVWLVAVTGAALLSGCTNMAPQAAKCRPSYAALDRNKLMTNLSAAEARWAAAGIRDYQYDSDTFPEPAPTISMRWTVRAGQVVSAIPLNGYSRPPTDLSVGRIEAWFSGVRQSIDFASSSSEQENCRFLSVDYDPVDGHVLSISSGYASPTIADGGGYVSIRNFIRLEAGAQASR